MPVKIKKAGAANKDGPKDYAAKKPTASVDIEKKTNGQSVVYSYTELVDTGALLIEGPHANVSFKAGTTRNLGDFNSARVDVMLTLPTLPSEEGIESAYEFAHNWVDGKLEEILESMNGDE